MQTIKKRVAEAILGGVNALNAGINKVHLIDGRIKHSLLLEIFTDAGIGTMFTQGDA